MDGNPSLAAEGVHREYGAVTALDGVDLAVAGPEILSTSQSLLARASRMNEFLHESAIQVGIYGQGS